VHCALPDDAEALIAQFIQYSFVELGRGLDRSTLKLMVLMLVQFMVTETFFPLMILNFKCFNHFLNAFLRQHDLSFWCARAPRRSEIDNEECTIFIVALIKVARDFPEVNIVNFD
jgi:hypothetical protein